VPSIPSSGSSRHAGRKRGDAMSDTDPLPRPPRRRINGVRWVYLEPLWPSFSGLYGMGSVDNPQMGYQIGYAMGCVKDDDGQLPDRFTEEAG